MKKKYIHLPRLPRLRLNDHLLYEELKYTGNKEVKTEYALTVFDSDGVREHHYTEASLVLKALVPDKMCWLHVKGMADVSNIEKLCTGLGMPYLWIQDVLNDRHIAKIEESPKMVFTVIDAFSYNEQQILNKDHLSLLLGENLVVSFQETPLDPFEGIRKAIVANVGKVRVESADYLYNLLLSNVVDSYLQVLDYQRDRMLDMEDTLMEFNSDHEEMGRSIQYYRKDYMRLRKNIMPLKDEWHELMEVEGLIKEQNKIYYKDTFDHLTQVFQLIDNAKETIASLVDLYMANTSLRMNHIMKRLTVMSTIFIPLTFMVGVWGMNFDIMPELRLKYGYYFAWATMLIIGVIVYFWLRKKKWY